MIHITLVPVFYVCFSFIQVTSFCKTGIIRLLNFMVLLYSHAHDVYSS